MGIVTSFSIDRSRSIHGVRKRGGSKYKTLQKFIFGFFEFLDLWFRIRIAHAIGIEYITNTTMSARSC